MPIDSIRGTSILICLGKTDAGECDCAAGLKFGIPLLVINVIFVLKFEQ